jgi:hypothetical protein
MPYTQKKMEATGIQYHTILLYGLGLNLIFAVYSKNYQRKFSLDVYTQDMKLRHNVSSSVRLS